MNSGHFIATRILASHPNVGEISQPCIGLKHEAPPKKEIAYTQSLGQPVTLLSYMTQVATEFVSGAAA